MTPFFEVINSKIGFSRIGRLLISKNPRRYVKTPNIIIPIKNILMRQLNFIEQFENHDSFIISKEIFLKISFIKDKFKNTGFMFTHSGTLEKFQQILVENLEIFYEDNIMPIIPFNIPTTTINKDFTINEISNYLNKVKKILLNHQNLYFGLTIKIFDHPELIDQYIQIVKDNNNIKILNLADIFDNFNNYRSIVEVIVKLKTEIDRNIIVMASGRIIPKYYPILVYLGVDLIDSSYLLYLSSENFYDSIEYLLPIYKVEFLPCSCIACQGRLKKLLEDKFSIEKTDLLTLHNLISATTYLKKINQYLKYEDYRIFVEKSTFDDTNLISLIKILDKSYFEVIKFETPIKQEGKTIKSIGSLSYYRPDFQEFRIRVIDNFEPESWTSLIILLPCSAKKPYSESKSHKLFHRIIRKFPDFPNFQEFIITSPLGAIPRQLENVYPVNSYEISVTGVWDNEEINIASEMLIKILKKYDYKIPIISHLEGGYLEAVKIAESKLERKFVYSKITGKITSKESLQSLKKLIEEHKDNIISKKIDIKGSIFSKSWIRKFKMILDYHYGLNFGKNLFFEELILKINKHRNEISIVDSKNNDFLGIFSFKTGQIRLTIKGLEKIVKNTHIINSNFISFDGNSISGNTLFRPGILNYSSDLIPNNYVVVLNKDMNNIIALGELLVGSNFIKNSKTGRIVKIYEQR